MLQPLVSPERVLHLVRYEVEEDLQAVVPKGVLKRWKLVANLRQLLGWTEVGNSKGDDNDRNDRKEAGNWQLLEEHVRWLQHDEESAMVPVVGKNLHVFSTVVVPHPKMGFNARKLQNLRRQTM